MGQIVTAFNKIIEIIIRVVKKAMEWQRKKYRGADLNRRPSGYESDALTS